MQTLEDLGRAVKAKYAGQYDDLPDAEVGKRVQAKYPGAYDDYGAAAEPAPPASSEHDAPKGYAASKLAPDPTPTAQSRWTRTPIAFGQTYNAPGENSADTTYGNDPAYTNRNYGSGPATLIEANMGSEPIANGRMLRHESIHALLSASKSDWGKVLADPVLRVASKPIVRILKANGYKGDEEDIAHELPAYLGAFTTSGTDPVTKLPSEYTSGVTPAMRRVYVAAFARALGKQDPESAAKYQRMLLDTSPGAQPGAAQNTGDLPHPDVVDQQTTAHAQMLAERITRPDYAAISRAMAQSPPPVRAPIPPGLQGAPDVPVAPMGPGSYVPAPSAEANSSVWHPMQAGAQIGQGAAQVVGNFNPTNPAATDLSEVASGTHKVIAGGFEAATPLMAGSAAAAPIKTAVSVGAGMLSQTAVEAGLKRLGLPEEYSALAGDLVGILAGVGTHEAMSPRAVAAIKARVEPVLKARAERTNAPEPTANSTGTEPYRPAVPEEKTNATQTETRAEGGPVVSASAGGGEPAAERESQPESKGTAPAVGETESDAPASEREIGPHGPVYREFRGDEAGATDKLLATRTGEAVGVFHHELAPSIDLPFGDAGETKARGFGLAKIEKWHKEMLYRIQPMLDRAVPDPEHPPNENTIQLVDGRYRAVIRKNWKGSPKTWLLTAFGPEEEGAGEGPSAGRTIDVPDTHGDGRQTPQPGGSDSSLAADKPADKAGTGSTYLGSGLGAFEPFLRDSVEEMRALKAKRDAAIEELERSKITPGEKKWGDKVLHFFTGERDLWAARANQGIAKARKLTIGSRERSGPQAGVDTDAEAVAIMREFKGRPVELKAWLDGTHPNLAAIEDPEVHARVMQRLAKLRPVIARAMAPDAQMQAVDAFYTQMAERTATEGKHTGTLETTWNPETYVPHVLNPRGTGEFPGVRKAIGQALGGKIGKYFGFSEHRSYPTLLDAIAADVIPKTLNIHDAFTIQQDHFARARATRLLEDQLIATNVGKYTVRGKAPEGWEPLAPHATEFRQLSSYPTGEIDEQGQPVTDVAEKRLFVPKFIADALLPITAPDFTPVIMGVNVIRQFQRYTKAIQLGLSFFHAVTENYMALANMGPTGWAKALFVADRDSPEFLLAERDFIGHTGTTSIQGNTVEAYKALQPGSIPTYTEIWRRAPVVKQMDEIATAISEFTFNNIQRRFKVTDYELHTAAWMAKHPEATAAELTAAKISIAKEINAVYGGLHWETLRWNKASVEIARAIMLAPDWTLSNIFNLKYTVERGTPASGLARMFWIRTIVGGLATNQALSLMFSGHLSRRPTMVYMGKDRDGKDIFQNIVFKGSAGDVTNLITNIHDYGLQGIARSMAGKGAPVIRTGLQLISNHDYLGHEIAPKGLNPIANTARAGWAATKSLAPIPLSFANMWDMLFGPEAHKYKMPEYFTTMFAGNPPAHVPPTGTHMSNGVLRPNAIREKNSLLDQTETGQKYRKRGR